MCERDLGDRMGILVLKQNQVNNSSLSIKTLRILIVKEILKCLEWQMKQYFSGLVVKRSEGVSSWVWIVAVCRGGVTLYDGVGNSVYRPKRSLSVLGGPKGSPENIFYFGRERFWLVPNSLLIFFFFVWQEQCIELSAHNLISVISTYNILGWTSNFLRCPSITTVSTILLMYRSVSLAMLLSISLSEQQESVSGTMRSFPVICSVIVLYPPPTHK